MDQPTQPKPVIWVGPARRELKGLPREVQRTMGLALWFAQQGRIHPAVIYVLCAFQKKATKGISTPKHLLNRVAERLRQARAISQQRGAEP